MRFVRPLTLLVVAAAAFPAQACEYEFTIIQLPGENAAAARARTREIAEEFFVTRQYVREQWAIKNSSSIYIARVLSNNRAAYAKERPQSSVLPVEAIRGQLPKGPVVLSEARGHSCSNWGDGDGDGEGTAAAVGTLVIVFGGLPKSEEKPKGIDSLRATSIRDSDLLDRLQKHGRVLGDLYDPNVTE